MALYVQCLIATVYPLDIFLFSSQQTGLDQLCFLTMLLELYSSKMVFQLHLRDKS